MVVQGVSSEPVSAGFPCSAGNLQAIFAILAGFHLLAHRNLLNLLLLSSKFPTRRNRELVWHIRLLAGNSLEHCQSPELWLVRPVRRLPNLAGPRAGIGQKRPFTGPSRNDRLRITERSFGQIPSNRRYCPQGDRQDSNLGDRTSCGTASIGGVSRSPSIRRRRALREQ
jgi:hypothetical protein